MSLAEVFELGSDQRGYWSEERKLIRDTARSFAIEEVLPVANRLDPEKGEIPQSLVDKMGDLGFFGITIPEDLGGLGLGGVVARRPPHLLGLLAQLSLLDLGRPPGNGLLAQLLLLDDW